MPLILFLMTDFGTWIVSFNQLMLVVKGVVHEADNAHSIWSSWLCFSAGPISHNSIHLLITTADFVALY